jgi:DNA-binding NarL/FixJ family response regulator
MDQVVSDRSRAKESLERIVGALRGGIILTNSNREIVWIDAATRARLNGGMEDLTTTLRTLDTSGSVSCCLSAHQTSLNGEAVTVCIIQEGAGQAEPGFAAIAAVEAAMAETTSWFTRAIVDKLKALSQTHQSVPRTSDLEALSDREREVLGLICEGRSDAQMSTMLRLSQNTVRNHIASLYRKIGVNRRTAAIIWARERGITAQDALSLRHRTRPRSIPRNTKYLLVG